MKRMLVATALLGMLGAQTSLAGVLPQQQIGTYNLPTYGYCEPNAAGLCVTFRILGYDTDCLAPCGPQVYVSDIGSDGVDDTVGVWVITCRYGPVDVVLPAVQAQSCPAGGAQIGEGFGLGPQDVREGGARVRAWFCRGEVTVRANGPPGNPEPIGFDDADAFLPCGGYKSPAICTNVSLCVRA